MPGLVVGLLAGAIADRVTPLKMILLMECGQMLLAFLLAALVATGDVPIWQMAAILSRRGSASRSSSPAGRCSSMSWSVLRRCPTRSRSALGLFNSTRVIGPALAGICLTYLGATGCFALNGLSYVAAIAAVLSIRLERPERSQPHANFTLRDFLGVYTLEARPAAALGLPDRHVLRRRGDGLRRDDAGIHAPDREGRRHRIQRPPILRRHRRDARGGLRGLTREAAGPRISGRSWAC